jgi:hypothetical protein
MGKVCNLCRVLWNWYISRAHGHERTWELLWLEILRLQMMMRLIMVLMVMIMIFGILSVWKEYFWANNLGLMLKPGSLLVIITWPTKSNCLILTAHKASPPQPNETTAEYVDVYSPLLYTPTPQVVHIATTTQEKMKSWRRISRSSKSTMSSRRGVVPNPQSAACEGRCWGLVLKCYELRTRQHKSRLMVNVLRPSKHYFPKDITIFGRRLWRTYLLHHSIYQWKMKHMKHEK